MKKQKIMCEELANAKQRVVEVGSSDKNGTNELHEKHLSLFVGQIDKTRDFALKMSESIGETIAKAVEAYCAAYF